MLSWQYIFVITSVIIVSYRLRGGTSPIFSSPSRARALNVEPGRARACPNFPRASFEPKLSTNKNANIRVRAYGKIRLVEPRAWGLFTASPKSGPGLRARAQARSTSTPYYIRKIRNMPQLTFQPKTCLTKLIIIKNVC